MPLKLTNTLTNKKELFIVNKEPITIYICGMTVQGPPHLGHMRAYITADLLIRYLRYLGYSLKVIQNFTDIDDKILEKAQEEKIDYRVIARRNIEEYFSVADQMNITRADFYPLATQHVQEIIELIQKLIDKGYAYVTAGDVYFSVAKFKDYGKLSKKRLEELLAGARIEVSDTKKNPEDFALWKSAKDHEPYWLSPWGRGRPGWHIECSAMSMAHLGETIDIHLGGEDLIFPHHENEIAQSEAATGKIFVRYWIHNGMLTLTGEKMSKSTKHFIIARELLERYNPNVLRLYFLKSHYRSPQEFDFDLLEENKNAYQRIQDFLLQVQEKGLTENIPSEEAIKNFKEAMDDDLNTPKVLALIFDAIKEGFSALQNNDLKHAQILYSNVKYYLKNLGFKQDDKSWSISSVSEKILKARDLARNNKSYEIADLIREGLLEMGFILEDTSQGTRVKRKS
jgi:cysteinyl-tRNA synthetase